MSLGDANLFLIFAFVLARLLPLGVLFPVAGGQTVPTRLRVALVVLVSLMITPLYMSSELVGTADWTLAVRLLRELLFGLALALTVLLLIGGLQMAGSLISQLSGLALVDVADPGSPFGATPVERLFGLLTVAVFLSVGGHRQLVDAILDTFRWVPPGRPAPAIDAATLLVDLLTHSLELAIRASAPVVFSLLISTLVVGLVARSMPQVGMFGIGLGINLAVLMVVLAISNDNLARLFEFHLDRGLEHLIGALDLAVASPRFEK